MSIDHRIRNKTHSEVHRSATVKKNHQFKLIETDENKISENYLSITINKAVQETQNIQLDIKKIYIIEKKYLNIITIMCAIKQNGTRGTRSLV